MPRLIPCLLPALLACLPLSLTGASPRESRREPPKGRPPAVTLDTSEVTLLEQAYEARAVLGHS